MKSRDIGPQPKNTLKLASLDSICNLHVGCDWSQLGQSSVIKMSSKREAFLRRLQQPADPSKIFSSMGIVLQRIERVERPTNKLVPEGAKETMALEEVKATEVKPVIPAAREIPSLEELRARRKAKLLNC